MNVDFTAMWQGVIDASDSGYIDENLFIALYERIRPLAYPGETGRLVVPYSDLLSALALVEPTTDCQYKLVCLWRHLGTSLVIGLSTASQE